MSFTVVNVSGSYINSDGSVPTGYVTFELTATMVNTGSNQIAEPQLITVPLVNGVFSQNLLANDDTNTTPTNIGYQVVEYISGELPRVYQIVVPHSSAAANLATLQPPVGTSISQQYGLLGAANTWTAQQTFKGTATASFGLMGQRFISDNDADVHTHLRAGHTTDYRNYLWFAPYNDDLTGNSGGWLAGRNAQDCFIIFGQKDAVHRFWGNPASLGGSTVIASVGAGAVAINNGTDPTDGTGGLIVYSGGASVKTWHKLDGSGLNCYIGGLLVRRGSTDPSPGSASVTLNSAANNSSTVFFNWEGVSKFSVGINSSGLYGVYDYSTNFYTIQATPGAGLSLNSQGAAVVAVNPTINASTGGFAVYSGGASPTTCGKIDPNGLTVYQGSVTVDHHADGLGASLTLNGSTSQANTIFFNEASVSKWGISKRTSGEFAVYDYTANLYRFIITTNGGVGINQTGSSGGLSVIPYNRSVRSLIVQPAATLTATINNVALTTNVATITTTAAHGFVVGESVVNSGLTTTALNGTFSITAVTSNTYSFNKTNADIPSTPDSGTATVSQSANLLDVWNTSNQSLVSVSPSGSLTINNPTDNQGNLTINSGSTAAQNSVVTYQDRGVSKWQVGKDSSNNYRIFDLANSKQMLLIAPNTGNITHLDGASLIFGTSTGTKIGTATTQKLGFFNATPIVQPATTGTSTGFTAGAGTAVTDQSTFTGGIGTTAYRISDIILALKSLGLLAS